MKASLRVLSLSFLLVVGMGLGTYSQAQDVAVDPACLPAEVSKPTGKMIPEDLTADLNVSFYSQYIWRGYELSRGSLVIFPSMTVGYKGFAVNLWADLDTRFAGSDNHGKFRLQETDVTVSYSNAVEPWKLNYTVGWILYNYQPAQNQELFLSLGLDTILKPTFTVYNEIEIGQAWYFSLGVSHSFPVNQDWSLDVGGWVSYLHDKSDNTFANFHDGNISAGLKIPLNNYLSVKPNIQYSFPLSGDASREIRGLSFSDSNNFVYGGIIFDLAI
ncbi:MAG: hypothetical protein EG822_08180 [Deltaproteobacteria bacterium]|nr:hypothetical protein [Deltaproteobacteria bacterium]TLN02239.1 MAG: hypothetical protein FDZ73_12780 [bacterium]